MTTLKFDKTPTPNEAIKLDDISVDSVKAAWKDYEAKPEYKKVNKHDLIEAMQSSEKDSQPWIYRKFADIKKHLKNEVLFYFEILIKKNQKLF